MDELDAMLENGPWFIRNNPLILKKWHPDEYLLKEDVSTVPVWVKLHGVTVTACSEDGLSAIATKLGTLLMLDSYTSHMCMQSWGRSSHARVMTELRADVELKDNIVVAMLKIKGKAIIYVMSVLSMSGDLLGVLLVRFLDIFMRNVQRIQVPVPMGTINFVNNEATSSGSSFMNVDNNSIGTTPIMDKIEKFENLIIDGQAILVDKAGNPLKKVVYLDDHDSEDEVASVDNDMARDLAFERTGFGTQCLLKQWSGSYGNGGYDEDPYYDDMYEGQDLSEEIQTICDKLDIRVRGPKKQ
uniref:Uncharacterized protein n=1 Tax=Tanacetum cinerariifolium TaxID=118510 RepID=A0A6L2NI58_TANCI|nr:hypothetical protein [Tanacetum cinerariifolium]